MLKLLNRAQDRLDSTRRVDFLAPVALRLYLAAVFWTAGMNKVKGFDGVVEWFGNTEWGLGLPAPFLMALLATATEVVGAIMLLIGLGVRWVSLPLLFTMIVAMASVHWSHGWQAVADASSPFPPADIHMALERLQRAREILQEHGNYEWLTASGQFVVSNNGVEWSVTYAIMLLALLFMGAGRWLSLDYWIARRWRQS